MIESRFTPAANSVIASLAGGEAKQSEIELGLPR
jgi:hypothetical protein